MSTTNVEIPKGWTAGPDGTIVPPDGWSEDPNGISLVTSGPATSDVPTTMFCYRQTGQPPVLQPLFQGTLDKDGTVTLLDTSGQPVGTGTFGLDGKELDVKLANGQVQTIDLGGANLQVADGVRGSTFAVGSDGHLSLLGTSVLGDGGTQIRIGSQLLTVPAGAILTVDSLGKLFVNGVPLKTAPPSPPTTVTTWSAPQQAPPGMDTKLKLPDGTEITVGQYASYMTVDIQSMSDLADCIDSWADSVDYTMTLLDTKLAGIDGAIGNDDPGKQFMPQYHGWHRDTKTGFKQMSDSVRLLAKSLRDGAQKLFETEDANLKKFIGLSAVDPRLTPPPPDTPIRRPGGGYMF